MEPVLLVNFTTFCYDSPHLPPPELPSVVLIWYILPEQIKTLVVSSLSTNTLVLLLSGPSGGCDAITGSSSEGLRWLLMERTRKTSAPVDESHRHWPFPRGPRWPVQFTPQPCSGWLGSEGTLVPPPPPPQHNLHIACLHKSRCYKYTSAGGGWRRLRG